MIVNFSIQNFGSIKDKQTLSFEADKSEHLENYYVIQTNGLRLLKLGLIYGANASGKTTILNALQFLRNIVLKPDNQKNEIFQFEPFLFDSETPNQNTILSLEFIQNNVIYCYEVELNKKAIVQEKLQNRNPNKSLVYERTTDLDKQFTQISFGSKLKIDKVFEKTLISNTLWNNTVLGGFLKTNIEVKELKDVTDWFENYLSPLIPRTELDDSISARIDKSDVQKRIVLGILKKADFNISDILIKSKEIKLEHTISNSKFTLPFEEESKGTQRYYGFAGILYLLVKNSTAFPIDELEASLHPDLFVHFLLSFLVNSKKSQIIATTHNREILNNKDIFRNDAIWITDKDNENCATELYSLADFDTSVIRDTSNIYNAYKIGKLGGVPNLGDYYINIDDEEQ